MLQSGEFSSSVEDEDEGQPQQKTTTDSAPDVTEEAITATTAATAETAVEPEAASSAPEPLSPTTLTVTIVLKLCHGVADC